jgi:tetratricopeptide (TPR) repeat protein
VLAALQISHDVRVWYDLGRHLLCQLTPAALWNSRVCFEQAVIANGRDGRGHSALALTSALLYILDAGNPESLVERIRECAHQGTCADCVVESHVALAVVAWGHEGDWNEAERLLNIARKTSRSSRAIHYWRALFLASAGRVEEAAEELTQAHDPRAFSVASELAFACAQWLKGEYQKAASRIRWVLAAEPKNPIAHLLLGWVLLANSRPQQAIEPLEMAQMLSGPGSPATPALGFATARAGQPEQARDLLEELLRGDDGRYPVDVAAGIIHLGLGEESEARLRFRTAHAKQSGRLGLLHFTPELGALRSAWFTVLLAGQLAGVFVA